MFKWYSLDLDLSFTKGTINFLRKIGTINNKLVSKLDPFTFYVVKTKAAFQGRTVCTRLFYCFGFSLFLYLLFVFWIFLSSLTFLVFLIIFIFLAYSFIVFNEPVSKKLFCQCKIITQTKQRWFIIKHQTKADLYFECSKIIQNYFLMTKWQGYKTMGFTIVLKKHSKYRRIAVAIYKTVFRLLIMAGLQSSEK